MRHYSSSTLFFIYQGVDEGTFKKILDEKSSKHAWEILQKSFQRVEKAKNVCLQSLRTKFGTLKMKIGETIADYFTRVQKMVNQMKRNGDKINDERVMGRRS